MRKSVCELQREEIERLTATIFDLTHQLVDQVDVNGNLSHVLAHLTDGRFREFVEKHEWNHVISEFLESDGD